MRAKMVDESWNADIKLQTRVWWAFRKDYIFSPLGFSKKKNYTHYITCICACDNKTVLLLAADKLQMRIFVIFCSEMKGDGDGTSKAVTD